MDKQIMLMTFGNMGFRLHEARERNAISANEINIFLRGRIFRTYNLRCFEDACEMDNQIIHFIEVCGYSVTANQKGLFFE